MIWDDNEEYPSDELLEEASKIAARLAEITDEMGAGKSTHQHVVDGKTYVITTFLKSEVTHVQSIERN